MDGIHFTSINNSKSTGATAYNVQDANIPVDVNTLYYRVKATDVLGKTSYTNVIKVVITNYELRITLSPNPVKNRLNITVGGATTGSLYSVKITTATGKLAFSKLDVPVTGTGITFDASGFAAGVYLVELADAKGNKLVSKFVKE